MRQCHWPSTVDIPHGGCRGDPSPPHPPPPGATPLSHVVPEGPSHTPGPGADDDGCEVASEDRGYTCPEASVLTAKCLRTGSGGVASCSMCNKAARTTYMGRRPCFPVFILRSGAPCSSLSARVLPCSRAFM